MDAVIALIIAAFGAQYCGMDFCTMHTFISVALALYKQWIDYTNDKAASDGR